jgi:hypothetical protein
MKKSVRCLASVIFAVALCCVLPALGQNSSLSFNGGYQGDVWCGGSEGCVATGFYDGVINGQQVGPGGAGGLGMICDDYNRNIYPGESWSANGIDAANLNSGNINLTEFGKQLGNQAIQVYTEMAYLVNQAFTTNPNSTQQSNISQAIWYLTGGVTWSQLSSGAQSLVTCAMTLWQNGSISLSQFANLMLYTPTGNGSLGAGPPQEMWGQALGVAEGGAALIYLLLAGVACFGAMFYSRSQRAKRALA